MSGTIRHRSETDIRLRQLEKEAARNSSPCARPPATPTTAPTLVWGIREVGNHLGFRVRATFDAVTEDIHGFPDDTIQTYEVQAIGLKLDGTTPAENKNGKPISRFVTVSASGKKSNADAGSGGSDNTLWNQADLGKAIKPKWVKWKVRYRAQNGQSCWSDWSPWSAAELPDASNTINKPPAPTFTSMDFQKAGSGRGQKHRLVVTFQPVRNWDIEGGDTEDDVASYVAQLEFKEPSGSWTRHGTKKVSDYDADNEGGVNANAAIKVVFRNIVRGNAYRVRLRSIDRFNRRGDWSAWYPDDNGSSKDANADKPAAITGGVNGESTGPRRVEFDWEDSIDPEFGRYRIVVEGSSSDSGGFSTVKTVKHKASRYRYVVPKAAYESGIKFYRATVYVQSDPDAAGNRVESTGVTSSVVMLADDESTGGGGNEVPALQTPQNASSAFNKTTRVHSAAWDSPDNLDGYLRTRIQTFGSVDGNEFTLLSTHNITSTAANTAQTWQRTWTVNEVATYLKARLTIQHIADSTGVKRDGTIWTSAPKDTRDGTVTPPTAQVAAPTGVSVQWNPAGNYGVRAAWTDPSPTTNIAYLQLRFQGGTTVDGPWDVISDDITVNVPAANNYTYITTTQERGLYRWYRVRVRSIASDPTVSVDSDWVNADAVDSGLGGGTPPPALALPTVTILSRTAAPITGGVRFKIRLTGSSGLPNGSADQIQWVLRRSSNSGATWTDRPFDGAAPGSVHAQGVIPTNGATSGTSVTYSEQVDYFLDQNTDEQMFFQLYAKAQDSTNGVGTEWVKSGQFTLSPPTAPGQPLAGSGVWINASLAPYFRIIMAPAPNDFRSGESPPSSSMGENDIGYYISWAISTSSTAPSSGWTEVFRRTSSELGNGVEWDGTYYNFRVPATDRLGATVNQNQFLWVKVRVRYIGDGGNDAGDNLRGSFSAYNTPERLPRMGAF